MADAVRALVDDAAVARVMVHYAQGIDRRDWDLVRSCFAPDAYVKGSSFEGPREEYLSTLFAGVERFPVTMHFIGNQDRRLDGDTARTETYLIAHHFADPAGEVESIVLGVRYHDQLARQGDGTWAITRRDVHADWRRMGPPPPERT